VEPVKLKLTLTDGQVVEMLRRHRWPDRWNARTAARAKRYAMEEHGASLATLPLQDL